MEEAQPGVPADLPQQSVIDEPVGIAEVSGFPVGPQEVDTTQQTVENAE